MDRTGFIGGSDTIRIMQGDWAALWEEKTGRKDPEDLSRVLPVQLGVWTEEFNVRWFEWEMNLPVDDRNHRMSSKIGSVPVSGEIDGRVTLVDDTPAMIEAKHTNSRTNFEEILQRYMPQIQTYMALGKFKLCYLSVIFGNERWETKAIAFNEDYFNSMWAVVSDFWSHVERDARPADDTPIASIDTNPVEVDNMVVRDAAGSNSWATHAREYLDNEAAARSFENAKKSLKQMVGANEREVRHPLLTAKRDARKAVRFYKGEDT